MNKRQRIIAGNWKMNLNFEQSNVLFEGINRFVENHSVGSQPIVFPQTIVASIFASRASKNGSRIQIGIQGISEFESGAYTGENSAQLAKSIGFDVALIGHSERRHIFKETNESMSKRISNAHKCNLSVMYCVGETLEQREKNLMEKVLKEQLDSALDFLGTKLTIAYEPVWAIGTGKTATSKEASEAHLIIRNYLNEKRGEHLAESTSILYGGSVKVDNATELLQSSNIDGLLIGGASLQMEDFCKILAM